MIIFAKFIVTSKQVTTMKTQVMKSIYTLWQILIRFNTNYC